MSGSRRTGFLKYSVIGSETYYYFFFLKKKVKQRNKNFTTGDPKRNRTRVTGMASDTHYHCATAIGRKPSEFGHGLL